ncbi:hypothetical protein [Alteromonas sp. KUL49]|uniref:hypothetical protein n=1 Tax=Alteromonas sp. KUL49 TaxID=2480798 RepID=UPI00102EDE5D|nr:hypothetical protein [Alteromonas sp. KUL49]TAP41305.1 hypothetical protein EYS00_03685 [Alteromonas sp. KUL49]GEA10365.1 hypothetical protein KUL49_07400 [Alteromonas sp. KUL49]
MNYNIYDLIEKISKRTEMYTGKRTLSHVRCFLDGYALAMHKANIPNVGTPEFAEFHNWVANKFGFEKLTIGYPEILLAVSLGESAELKNWNISDYSVTKAQHDKSVDLFFSLVSEYKSA